METTITNPILRDYKHASQLYVADNFNLVPKFGFLFHVFFDINTEAQRADPSNPITQEEIGLLVRSIDLPKFSIDTKIHNAYNRPNIVQSKIKYDNINASFHDDSADIIRNFWFDYYNYYYRDADYGEEIYFKDHKYTTSEFTPGWGFTPRNRKSIPYLKSIRIYSLHHKKFSEYVLINPLIKSFRHGQHDQTTGDSLLTHDMTIEYESVLYNYGDVSSNTVKGFAQLHYDKTASPLRGKVPFVNASDMVHTLGQGSSFRTFNKASQSIPPANPMNEVIGPSFGSSTSSYPYSVPNEADSNAEGVDDAIFKNTGGINSFYKPQDDASGVDQAVFRNSGYQQDDATGVDAAVANSGYTPQDDATGVNEAVAEQERLARAPSNYNPTMPDEISPTSTEVLVTANDKQTASSADQNQGSIDTNRGSDIQYNLTQLNNDLSRTETGLTNLSNSIENTTITISQVNTQYQAALALSEYNPGKQALVLQLNQQLTDLADTKSDQQGLIADYTAIKSGLVTKIQTTKAEVDAAGGYQ